MSCRRPVAFEVYSSRYLNVLSCSKECWGAIIQLAQEVWFGRATIVVGIWSHNIKTSLVIHFDVFATSSLFLRFPLHLPLALRFVGTI